jgi:hypothetical protein
LDHSYLVGKSTSSKLADTKVRTSEVLKLLFQQFLKFSSSQQNMSGPILEDLSNDGDWGVHSEDMEESWAYDRKI